MRCFIAMSLPESIRHQLLEIQSELRKFHADVSWTRPEGIHLTLKFLGEISESRILPIQKELEEIGKNRDKFDIGIIGTGVFPDPGRPRVLWIGVSEGREETIRLAESVESGMDKLGFPKEDRKFHPHLTLGRVKSPKNIKELTNHLLNEMKPDLGKFTVDHLTLYQSILKPGGAEYTILAKANFQK